MCRSITSRGTLPSGMPAEKAKPALVVASALKPRLWRYRVVPMSQGLGSTKQPEACSSRKARRLSEAEGDVVMGRTRRSNAKSDTDRCRETSGFRKSVESTDRRCGLDRGRHLAGAPALSRTREARRLRRFILDRTGFAPA